MLEGIVEGTRRYDEDNLNVTLRLSSYYLRLPSNIVLTDLSLPSNVT